MLAGLFRQLALIISSLNRRAGWIGWISGYACWPDKLVGWLRWLAILSVWLCFLAGYANWLADNAGWISGYSGWLLLTISLLVSMVDLLVTHAGWQFSLSWLAMLATLEVCAGYVGCICCL
jgi:hypothetical protein